MYRVTSQICTLFTCRKWIAISAASARAPLLLCLTDVSTISWRVPLDSPARTLIQSANFREWIENLGRSAASPFSSSARLELVGLPDNGRLHVPFTQQDIADACGLSTAHVNRTFQENRRRKLIEWNDHAIDLLQRDQRELLGEFRPSYHLR
ncbi:helix-turn-helix domain-containing protein [Bradyrhizobium ivorense]|uniref:helix-turn-helix domain-containing protein n=1 Tax=Bradyrhizobium ivorense TaxID=2511166 RepID=UPI00111E5906